nr:MAG TPA: Protein F9 fusion complex associated protein [Bacteriophage sp.]
MRVISTGSNKGNCVLDTIMEVMSYRRRMEMD